MARLHPYYRLIPMLLLVVSCAARQAGPAEEKKSVPRPAMIPAKEWGSIPQPIDPARRHTPKFLTIHHAGVLWKSGDDPAAKLRGLQAYGQKEKNWPDVPYHFLIAPDGRIFEGRPIEYEPESNTTYDLKGNIGIELWGNFEQQRVNEEQIRALVKLSAWLCDQHGIDAKTIRGHRDVAKTACPGKDLYRYIEEGDIQQWVADTLQQTVAKVALKPALENGPTAFIRP